MIDALRELLNREWGETEEVDFILEAVEKYQDEFIAKEKKLPRPAFPVNDSVEKYMKVFDNFLGALVVKK